MACGEAGHPLVMGQRAVIVRPRAFCLIPHILTYRPRYGESVCDAAWDADDVISGNDGINVGKSRNHLISLRRKSGLYSAGTPAFCCSR